MTPGENLQRRARHQQPPKGGHNARPAPTISATPEAGSTHQARHPHIPPTRYTANARIQRPTTTRTLTPAPPTHPSPGGRRQHGGEQHDANWNRNQTKPFHNVPTTVLQAGPQVP